MTEKNFTLTQEYLKEIFDYCEDTGEFIRIKKVANCVKVGDVAGYENTHKDGKKYTVIRVKIKKYYAHILAVLYVTGSFPIDQVDHIDGDGLNNKWNNLRPVKEVENRRNRRMPCNNTSGCVGVYFFGIKWKSSISVSSKNINLGTHDSIFDAVCARKSAEHKYGFHKNHGSNRPL